MWYSKLFRIINSAVCFSLAYITITYLGFIMMALAGRIFKFDATVYYFGIKYILYEHKWTKLKITLVYLTYPIFALVFGLFCLFLYDRFKKFKTSLNLYFIWCFVIGTSIFSAQMIIASLGAREYNSPYYQHFGVVMAWWNVPVAITYIMNIPFAIILVFFSVNYTRFFLAFSYSFSKVNNVRRRQGYFMETAMVPFLIGASITTMVTFPMNIFVHSVYIGAIAIAMVIGWLALMYIEVMRDSVLKYKKLQEVNFIFLLALGLIISVIRFITWRGFFI